MTNFLSNVSSRTSFLAQDQKSKVRYHTSFGQDRLCPAFLYQCCCNRLLRQSQFQLPTIHGAAEEDCPLFSGLYLQFREEGHREWTVYHPYGSSRGKSPRAFPLHLLAFLPTTVRKHRKELAATATARVQGVRSEIRYDDLSKRAKELWDGTARLTPVGLLSAGGLSFR